MSNLFLIGFMGCGKTAVYELVKKQTEIKTIDTDLEIENRTNLKINQIFKNFGEPHFRNLESELLKKIEQQNNAIIATGGGTLNYNNNFKLIKPTSKFVFFDTKFEICFYRIQKSQKSKQRPNVTNLNFDQLKRLFFQRRQIYNKIATLTIKENTHVPITTKFKQTVNFFNCFIKKQ